MLPAHNRTLPLAMVGIGERVRLVTIASGQQLSHRLTEMGLTPGVEMEVMQDEGGTLLLAVRDTRLVLGRGMAHKIMVEALAARTGD